MKQPRTLALSSLSLVAAFVLASAPAHPSQSAGTGPSSAAVVPSAQMGKLGGTWRRPRPGQPGFAVGVLAEAGSPVYRLQVVVRRDASAPVPGGRLLGRLVAPSASGPVPVGMVVGRWVDRPGKPGRFEGVILRPDPTGQKKAVVAGKLEGTFVDPPQAKGTFAGRWVLAP